MKLTRKLGESIEIFRGRETVARITISDIRAGRVTIDIVAPLCYDILRSELIEQENDPNAIPVD